MIEAPKGRNICRVDMDYKNWHTLSTGTKIRLERDVENLNKRETNPVNGIVVSSAYIPCGAEVIIHHNSTHITNEIYNYVPLSGEVISSNIKYFSIDENECYAWRLPGGEWQPTNNFEFGLRVFKPYNGILQNIPASIVPQKLYITSGELKGKVVIVAKASDYEMVFQDSNGKESRIIRCRHFKDSFSHEREEILAIDHDATKKVLDGGLLIGLTSDSAISVQETTMYAS